MVRVVIVFFVFFLFWGSPFHLDVSCHILQLLYLRLRPFQSIGKTFPSRRWENILFFCSYFPFHFGWTRLIAKLFEVGLPISIDVFFISLQKFRRSESTLSSCRFLFFFLGPEKKKSTDGNRAGRRGRVSWFVMFRIILQLTKVFFLNIFYLLSFLFDLLYLLGNCFEGFVVSLKGLWNSSLKVVHR